MPGRRTVIKMFGFAPAALAAAGGSPELVTLPLSLGGLPVPVFENGFLGILDTGRTTVRRLDMAGQLAGPLRVSIPGAASWMVMGMGLSRNGAVAAYAGAKDSSGRLASLLVLAGFNTSEQKIIQLGDFGIGKLAFLPGGEMVCLGREIDPNFKEVPGHEVLRFYSPEGVLLRKALKVEALRTDPKERHPLNWLMRVNARSIALLDPKGQRYCEVDHAGQLARSCEPLPPFETPARISGFALAGNGDRIISAETGEPGGGRSSFRGKTVLYRFTDAGRSTVDLSFLPEWVRGTMVLGTYTGRLVLMPDPSTHLVICPREIG